MTNDKPGYHLGIIDKGTYGEFSKVAEEFQEVQDAFAQGCKIMALVELSDMLGAMEAFYTDFQRHVEQARSGFEHHKQYGNPVVYHYTALADAFRFMEKNDNPEWAVSFFLIRVMDYLSTFNMTIEDAMNMSTITKRAFINGRRISS